MTGLSDACQISLIESAEDKRLRRVLSKLLFSETLFHQILAKMSAISTVYKRPSSVSTFNKDDDNRAVVYTGGLMTAFMWVVVGLASAANTEITPNVTGKSRCICIFRNHARLCVLPGVSVSLTVIDALVMVLVNLFLMRGIEKVSI